MKIEEYEFLDTDVKIVHAREDYIYFNVLDATFWLHKDDVDKLSEYFKSKEIT